MEPTTREEVMGRLLAAKGAASRAAGAFARERAEGTLTQGRVTELVRAFIWAKFRLSADDVAASGAGDGIEALAQASLAKMLRIAPELVGVEDKAATCDGADSTTVKQALMLLALSREFKVELNGFRAALCEDVPALAALVWEAR